MSKTKLNDTRMEIIDEYDGKSLSESNTSGFKTP